MKKKILLVGTILLAVFACIIFVSDGWTYFITLLMALAIMGTIRGNRRRFMNYTRWAKANPLKAQVLITVLQIVLIVSGIIAGYNFNKLGYEVSDTSAYIFGSIIVFCFLSVPFLPKRNTIAIPQLVNRHRLGFMGIAISSFVMMVYFGNRIEEKYPDTVITGVLESIDQAIFPMSSTSYYEPCNVALEQVNRNNYKPALADEANAMAVFASFTVNDKESIKPPGYSKKEAKKKLKAEKKATRIEKKKTRMMNRLEKYRLAFAGGLSVGAVLLIILLFSTLCGGICLIIGGFSAGSAAPILLGAVVTAGSIWGLIKLSKVWGIIELSKGSKEKDKPEP